VGVHGPKSHKCDLGRDAGSYRVVIRPARIDDIPELVGMGRRFFDASGYADITTFDDESLGTTFSGLLTSESAVFLVVDKQKLVGMAAALIYPFYFNVKHRTAQEMFWWVDKEHRGIGSQLFDALIAGVKARGAESLSMIALERLTPEKVGGIYERRGFRPSERSYIKRI
jgi:GNAT superfamily N-acetyltransferase